MSLYYSNFVPICVYDEIKENEMAKKAKFPELRFIYIVTILFVIIYQREFNFKI